MIVIRWNSAKVMDSYHTCVSSCSDSIRAWSLRALGLPQPLCDGLSVKKSFVLLPPFSSVLRKTKLSIVTIVLRPWSEQFTREVGDFGGVLV